MAEDGYVELAMVIERFLCIEAWPVRRSMASVDASERQKLQQERQAFCTAVSQKLTSLRSRIKLNAELIRDYETELNRLK